MTLREKICAAGVSTLREYMCVETGLGGAVTINGEFIYLQEEKKILLYEEVTALYDEEMDIITIEETIIQIEEGDILDGV